MKSINTMTLLAGLAIAGMAIAAPQGGFNKYENATKDNVTATYKDGYVIFRSGDSIFIGKQTANGIENKEFNKSLTSLKADGAISYANGMVYYSKDGDIYAAKEKEFGKFKKGKKQWIPGLGKERNDFNGSMLAYASWRYLPKDVASAKNPSVTSDGNTIYFASNADGSKGFDIWKTSINEDGEWAPAERLGKEVNSLGNEDFPIVLGDSLIAFGSDRKGYTTMPDSGKFHTYISKIEDWKRPQLLSKYESDKKKEEEKQLIAAKEDKSANNQSSYNQQTTVQPANDQVANNNTANGQTGSNTSTEANANGQASTDLSNLSYSPVVNNVNSEEKIPYNPFDDGKPKEEVFNYEDDIIDETKSENDRILELLTKDETPMEPNKKVSVADLNEVFSNDQEAVVKASKNVVATADKRIFYFDYDKDVVNNSDYEKDFEVILEFINFYPKNSFLVIGHTDERGTYEYNDALSMKRAKKIESILVSKGVSRKRLFTMALGEYKPVFKNAQTEEQHQKNRRVEILIME
ncbi:MAG: OmpA family protein [Paludibacteraceae bacterium]|jgi:outer membrane protein OmpA-like peptidoglycan-associated protein|nr:OmpA family protein [Paludibacteraceae bacterium]MEE1083516.1 OmpA family protein [Paludibacteraceae bacterium]